MIFFYLLALVPIAIGIGLWYKNPKITLQEWGIGTGASLVLAFIFHMIALATIHSKTSDLETWSGRISRVEHWPEWVEKWEEMHTESYPCGSDAKGNTTYCTRVYYTTEYDKHHETWKAELDFGVKAKFIDISYPFYLQVKNEFGNQIVDGGNQPLNHPYSSGRYYNGNRSIYTTRNSTGYIHPVSSVYSFKNKVKATPNLFSFVKLSTNIHVYPYPANNDWDKSDRLIGTAGVLINLLPFDQMNAKLGPIKKANVILVGFGSKEQIYGQYQQSQWIGGKKNDLVICFGGGSKTAPASWAYCFGWSEKDIVKRNLETILLTSPINNSILDKLELEIKKNYVIKDWTKFDYITI